MSALRSMISGVAFGQSVLTYAGLDTDSTIAMIDLLAGAVTAQ